jgi:hypothetical protein
MGPRYVRPHAEVDSYGPTYGRCASGSARRAGYNPWRTDNALRASARTVSKKTHTNPAGAGKGTSRVAILASCDQPEARTSGLKVEAPQAYALIGVGDPTGPLAFGTHWRSAAETVERVSP